MPGSEREANFQGPVTQKALVRNDRGELLLVRSAPDRAWSLA